MGIGTFIMEEYEKIADIKRHLNIDFNDDDAYLSDLIATAGDVISTFLNRPLSDFRDSDGRLIPSVRHAIRLLVGTWYANREGVAYATPSEIPYTLAFMLTPLKRFVSADSGEEEA